MKRHYIPVFTLLILAQTIKTVYATTVVQTNINGMIHIMPGSGFVINTYWSSDNEHDVNILLRENFHWHVGNHGLHEYCGYYVSSASNTWDTTWSGTECTGHGNKTDILTTSYNCANGAYLYFDVYSAASIRKMFADDDPNIPPGGCSKGDPINPLNGSLMKNDVDIQSVGHMAALKFERIYDSNLNNTKWHSSDLKNTWRWPLGMCWTHNHNIYLLNIAGNADSMLLFDGGRKPKLFTKNVSDTIYKGKKSEARYLRYYPVAGTWRLYLSDGSSYKFKETGQLDTLYDNKGDYLKYHYSSSDSTLDSIKDRNNNKIVLEYDVNNKIKYIFGSTDVVNEMFSEYRYATYEHPGGGYKYLCQVLKHSALPTADSLSVLHRYYYVTQSKHSLNAGMMNTYAIPPTVSAIDTNWMNNRLKCARLNIWYDDKRDTCFDGIPVLYQEMVSDSASGNKVIYKALFKYYWPYATGGSNLYGPDSVSVYYFEDSSYASAHDPLDSLFSPADSLPSAFGTIYYVNTIRYNTTRTVAWERYYNPATGDSSKTTYSQYDKNYHPWLVTDPNGSQTHFVYGTYTDPWNPDSIRYMDSPKIIKYPNGDSTINFYSSKGSVNSFLPDSTVDEDGKRIHHHYDAAKNYADTAVVYKDRVLADGNDSAHDVTTRYHYSSKYNNLTENIDPRGSKTIMHYAPGDTGRFLTEQRIDMSPAGEGNEDIVTQYRYDPVRGILDTMTFYRDYPNNPSSIYYAYDHLNRQVRALNPDNSRDSTAYDLRGNVVGRFTLRGDTLLAKTAYEYDPHDYLTKVREYRAPNDSANAYDSTLYGYNLHGRLIKQTKPLGKVTSYAYAMDRLRKISYPDTTYDSLGYWPDGSLKFKVDRKGQVIYYEYDGYTGGCLCNSRYRLTKKKYYDSLDHYLNGFYYPSDSVVFEYDKVGNRTKMVDKLGTTLYAYDELYRLKSDSSGYLNTKVKYLYDQANNRTRMKVFKGDDTTTCYLDQEYRHYDNANRVDTVRVASQNYILSYWDTGMPKKISYPTNEDGGYPYEEYWANSRGFADSILGSYYNPDMSPHAQTKFRNRYTYDGLGDRTSQYVYLTRPGTTTLSGTIGYSYDGLSRLIQVRNPTGFNNGDTITYTYDAVGNRTKKDYRKTSDINYYYNSYNNQLSSDNDYNYTYDDNGNLIQITPWLSGQNRYFCYDFENRLTKVKQSTDSTIFSYNGDGYRLLKNGTTDTSAYYLPDGMYSVVELSVGRTKELRYKYVYANGMPLARIDKNNNKYFYYHDGLGSIIGISDGTNICKSYLYDEFGDSIGTWGSSPFSTYRYTGQEWDGAPLLAYNLRAREYYPKLGRFMQNDPIGDKGGTLNWYSYVRNNPVNWVDPTGKLVEICVRTAQNAPVPHWYLRVDGVGWGFVPKGNYPAGVIGSGYPVEGEVVPDFGGSCSKVSDNECYTKCVSNEILKSKTSYQVFQFYVRNCYTWTIEMLAKCIGQK